MRRVFAVSVLSSLLALSACGGGGSSSNSTTNSSTSSAEGLWKGLTSDSRTFTGIVLEDGTYWMIYSAKNSSNVIAGAVQGTGAIGKGSFTSSDAKDFNLEGAGIIDASVKGEFVTKQTLDGLIIYPPLGTQNVFGTSYDAAYEQTPSLAAVTGTYLGAAATSAGWEMATVTISSTGAISGTGATGCTYTGSMTPRAKGNLFDVSVTFGAGMCVNGNSTVTGVSYYDANTGHLTSAALNTARTDGFIYYAIKY